MKVAIYARVTASNNGPLVSFLSTASAAENFRST
jgi:hypothetical protein